MKKLLSILICVLGLCAVARADITSSNMVTYASTGGASTNNGTPIFLGNVYLPVTPNFVISDGGTATTNALTVYIQYGFDTNYFTTVATYTKASTNAADGVVTPSGVRLSIWAITRVVTTNSLSVGTKAIIQTQ